MIDAYRDQVYGAVYDEGLQPRVEPVALDPEALLAGLEGPVAVVGDGAQRYRARIEAACPEALFVARSPFIAAVLGRLAYPRLLAGQGVAAAACCLSIFARPTSAARGRWRLLKPDPCLRGTSSPRPPPTTWTGSLAVEERCATHPWTAGIPWRRWTRRCARGPSSCAGSTPRRATRVAAFCAFRRVADEGHDGEPGDRSQVRRRGLARLLLRTSLGVAMGDGARVAILEVRIGNQAARRLYESEGFRVAGERRGYYSEPLRTQCVLLRQL